MTDITPSVTIITVTQQRMKPVDIVKRLRSFASQDKDFGEIKWFKDKDETLFSQKVENANELLQYLQKLDMANALTFSTVGDRVKIDTKEYAPVEMMLFTLEGCPYCEMLVDDEEAMKKRQGRKRALDEIGGPVKEFENKIGNDFRFSHLQLTRLSPDEKFELKKNMAVQAWSAASDQDGPRFPFMRVISKSGKISEPRLWDTDANFARTARGLETIFRQQIQE